MLFDRFVSAGAPNTGALIASCACLYPCLCTQLQEDEAMLYIFDEVSYIMQPQCKVRWPEILRKFRGLSFTAVINMNIINEIEMVLHSIFSFLGGQIAFAGSSSFSP
jgi:hypothetical protein